MATQKTFATFSEIYDLGTKAGKTSVIGIHTPTGGKVYDMLKGFFSQFRKYRYTGADVIIQPAATLPADPLQVSYEAGEITIDPRDMLNPVMFHGTHGDSLGAAWNVIFKGNQTATLANEFDTDSTNTHDLTNTKVANFGGDDSYYAALSDPSFVKFSPQQTIKLPHLHPMVNNLVFSQEVSPSVNWPTNTVGTTNNALPHFQSWDGKSPASGSSLTTSEIKIWDGQIFTAGVRSLGWMPTHIPYTSSSTTKSVTGAPLQLGRLPLVYMGLIIMPPSYKQELYFRMVIRHHFQFKDFTTSMNVLQDYSVVNDHFYRDPTENSKMVDSLTMLDADAQVTTVGVS